MYQRLGSLRAGWCEHSFTSVFDSGSDSAALRPRILYILNPRYTISSYECGLLCGICVTYVKVMDTIKRPIGNNLPLTIFKFTAMSHEVYYIEFLPQDDAFIEIVEFLVVRICPRPEHDVFCSRVCPIFSEAAINVTQYHEICSTPHTGW